MKRRPVSRGTRGKHGLPMHSDSLSEDEDDQADPTRKSRRSRGDANRRNASLCLLITVLITAYMTWSGGYSKVKTKFRRPPSYTPKLLTAGREVDVDEWPWPVIHIVNTRLMQEQGDLIALGKARLALFQTFCLPTMVQQSTNRFLWIIKTDPSLDVDLLNHLVAELKRYPNIYLVASNNNFRINQQFPGAWRDGAEPRDLAASRIYTGNRTLLENAMALQAKFPVLETRLDADDGLHVEFLEQIQQEALEEFQDGVLRWLYWCARRHMDWHWIENKPCQGDGPMCSLIAEYGSVTGVTHQELCITPGITVGFPVGVAEQQVPVYPHHELAKRIHALEPLQACGYEEAADCLIFLENFVFAAVRSRTPTSHGMLNVQINQADLIKEAWVAYAFWHRLHDSFRISREHIKWINRYLTEHLIEIAHDNLLGQCTTGHSCKDEAKKSLEKLMASRASRNQTFG